MTFVSIVLSKKFTDEQDFFLRYKTLNAKTPPLIFKGGVYYKGDESH